MQNTLPPSFDRTQRTIFGLLAQTLFGVPYTPESDVDWMAVYVESECQAVRFQTFCNHRAGFFSPSPLFPKRLAPDLPARYDRFETELQDVRNLWNIFTTMILLWEPSFLPATDPL